MYKTRILTVAPYPEFQELTNQIAGEFPDIQIDVFTGDRDNAIDYLQAFPIQSYSAIISRGGTAEYLRDRVTLPVLEVEVSVYDMLRTLKQAEAFKIPFAVIGYVNIVRIAKNLCDILKYQNVEIVEATSDNVDSRLQALVQKGISLIVGDVMSVDAAAKYGIRSILITSSIDSLRRAIQESIHTCQNMKTIYSEIQLLHAVGDAAPSAVVLMDESGNIIMSNAAGKALGHHLLQKTLSALLPLLQQQSGLNRYLPLNNTNYFVRGSYISTSQNNLCVFFLSKTARALSGMQDIIIETLSDFPENTHFLFSNSDYIRPLLKSIHLFKDSHTPIHITGQIGTEKSSVARYLHWNSAHRIQPFIRIRCDILTPSHWDTFCNAANGPIDQQGCTLFFENVHMLSQQMQSELDAFLSGTFAIKQQYIVSSSYQDLQTMVCSGTFSPSLYKHLVGVTIHTPSLNERREDIPSLANLFTAKINGEYGKQVIGFEEDALEILKNYHWNLNLEQFQQVLSQLVLSCNEYYITADAVQTVLNEICPIDLGSSHLLPIDLSQTLEQIECDIISYIYKEEGMNMSATARRLGIGRSTLWRKLQM